MVGCSSMCLVCECFLPPNEMITNAVVKRACADHILGLNMQILFLISALTSLME
jgi:hypothetical protein